MDAKITVWLAAGLVFGGLVAACGSAQTADEEADESMVGKPPSETDDAYHVVQMPEEAVEAESSGYIGPEEGEGDDPSDESEEASEKGVRAAEADPPDEADRRAAPDGGMQCFSCVRICPLSEASGDADCSGGERDVICGWGVHSERSSARQLAVAECNGALDLARETRQWSQIEGECPSPQCRPPQEDG